MNKICLYLGIGISIIVFSCSDAQTNSSPEFKAETLDSGDIASDVSPIARHRPVFDTLPKLIQYYNYILDSLFKVKRAVFKNKSDISENLLYSLDSNVYAIQQEKNEAIYNYILINDKNSETLEGVKYLVYDIKVNIAIADNAFKSFPETMKKSTIGKSLSAKIEERKKKELIQAYDLSLLDLKFETAEGTELSLGKLPTKYILLDFWASWCTPCRYENRKLVEEKANILKDADISIIAVSTDVNKARWLKAVKDDGLNYQSICDYKEFESPIAKNFKVNGIPYNVIITKDGKVIASNLWGRDLREFIKTLK
ncbi:MAG: TlpA family protein disulfide reductase [Bacteroidota bacterium]